MTDIASVRSKIQVEETKHKAAVSEATIQKIGGTVNWIIDNAGDYVTKVETSFATEAQFAALKGYDYTESDLTIKKWILMSGQDITGSDMATLTGVTTAPNMVGNASFIGQKGSSHTLGQEQSAANLSHSHIVGLGATPRGEAAQLTIEKNSSENDPDETGYRVGVVATGGTFNDTTPFSAFSSGDSEMRPNTVRMNFFLKINN